MPREGRSGPEAVSGMAEEMPADSRADRSGMRFEAKLHRGSAVVDDTADLADLADLDLDRVPDPDGGVRLLADLDQCVRLVERGGVRYQCERTHPCFWLQSARGHPEKRVKERDGREEQAGVECCARERLHAASAVPMILR